MGVPLFVVIVAIFSVVAVGIGIWRKDPPAIVAMRIGGSAIYLLALRWAIELGKEPAFAALLASGGCIPFTMAGERSRSASRVPTA
jgi:hypothetical protein